MMGSAAAILRRSRERGRQEATGLARRPRLARRPASATSPPGRRLVVSPLRETCWASARQRRRRRFAVVPSHRARCRARAVPSSTRSRCPHPCSAKGVHAIASAPPCKRQSGRCWPPVRRGSPAWRGTRPPPLVGVQRLRQPLLGDECRVARTSRPAPDSRRALVAYGSVSRLPPRSAADLEIGTLALPRR